MPDISTLREQSLNGGKFSPDVEPEVNKKLERFQVMNCHHFLHCVGVWAVVDSWPLFGHL